ncbi:hypothetical protein OURE66S_03902 [Oligella ureolytica]
MAKSKFKNPLIIILVIAIIAIAAWFFLSNTVNKKAEELLQQYLIEHNLQDRVKWEGLEASPSGTANLKKVTFLDENGELFLIADEFNLQHYKEDENVLETKAEIKGLVDVQGIAFQEGLDELYKQANISSSDSVDVAWEIKLDNTQQTSYMSSDVLLPNLFSVQTELNTDSPEKFRELSKMSNNSFNSDELSEEDMATLMALMSDVKIHGINIGLVEKGGIEKLRYDLVASELSDEVDNLSPEQLQTEFERTIADARQMCIDEPQLGVVLSNQEAACNKVMDFIQGSSDAVKVNIAAAKPFSFDEILMMTMMGAGPNVYVEEFGLRVEVE